MFRTILGKLQQQEKTETFDKAIFILLIIALLIGNSTQQYRIDTAAGLLTIFTLSYSIYNLVHKKIMVAIHNMLVGLPFLISLFLFPYYSYAKWIMLLPIFLYILILFNWKENESALPVTTLLTVYSIYFIFKSFISL